MMEIQLTMIVSVNMIQSTSQGVYKIIVKLGSKFLKVKSQNKKKKTRADTIITGPTHLQYSLN